MSEVLVPQQRDGSPKVRVLSAEERGVLLLKTGNNDQEVEKRERNLSLLIAEDSQIVLHLVRKDLLALVEKEGQEVHQIAEEDLSAENAEETDHLVACLNKREENPVLLGSAAGDLVVPENKEDHLAQ